MDPLTWGLVAIGVIAVVVLILALRGGEDEEAQVEERLGRLMSEEEREKKDKEIEEEAKRLAKLTEGLNKVIEKRSFAAGISTQLAQASVKLTVAEYLILNFVSIVVGGALGYFIFRNILAFSGLILGFFFPRILLNTLRKRRLKKFNDQLGDTINLLVNGLRSGYSLAQAIEAVSRDMPPPTSEEFRRVVIELGLGVPLEQALDNMLRRVPSADLDLLITAINVQHEVGGNLAEILDIISYTIRERVRIQGEIKTLTAQGEISGYVISGLPFFLTAILYLMNREYMGRMFRPSPSQPCGWIMSGVAVLIIALGFFAMRKIVQIEV